MRDCGRVGVRAWVRRIAGHDEDALEDSAACLNDEPDGRWFALAATMSGCHFPGPGSLGGGVGR
jgi:hypothetical protein